MTKNEAIVKVEAFIRQKEIIWEAMYHVDEAPIEYENCWVFKNLYEFTECLRGDELHIDWDYPHIIVDKATGVVKEVTLEESSAWVK
ncbi:MAG: hypothetical protein JJT94_14360 [Bernardetiaceae bacterium]|nr:hypothetical protein [Bernardetiaceae bacterium]